MASLPKSESAKYESSNDLKARSEATQLVEGDCLLARFVSSLPEKVHLDLAQNDLTDLMNI